MSNTNRSVRLSEQAWAALSEKARVERRTVNWLVGEAVRSYLAAPERAKSAPEVVYQRETGRLGESFSKARQLGR